MDSQLRHQVACRKPRTESVLGPQKAVVVVPQANVGRETAEPERVLDKRARLHRPFPLKEVQVQFGQLVRFGHLESLPHGSNANVATKLESVALLVDGQVGHQGSLSETPVLLDKDRKRQSVAPELSPQITEHAPHSEQLRRGQCTLVVDLTRGLA